MIELDSKNIGQVHESFARNLNNYKIPYSTYKIETVIVKEKANRLVTISNEATSPESLARIKDAAESN